ncbi:hypothetical protein P9112_008787 [Eukaryota sp. TZLM1-RC]
MTSSSDDHNVNQTLLNQVEQLLNSLNGRVSSLETLTSKHQLSPLSHSTSRDRSPSITDTPPKRSSIPHSNITISESPDPSPSDSPASDELFGTNTVLSTLSESLSPSEADLSPPVSPSVSLNDNTEDSAFRFSQPGELTLLNQDADDSLLLEDLANLDISTPSSVVCKSSLLDSVVYGSTKNATPRVKNRQSLSQSHKSIKSVSSFNQSGDLSSYKKIQSLPTPRKPKPSLPAHRLSAFALLAIQNDGHTDTEDFALVQKLSQYLGPKCRVDFKRAFPTLHSYVCSALRNGTELKPWMVAPDEWMSFKQLINL